MKPQLPNNELLSKLATLDDVASMKKLIKTTTSITNDFRNFEHDLEGKAKGEKDLGVRSWKCRLPVKVDRKKCKAGKKTQVVPEEEAYPEQQLMKSTKFNSRPFNKFVLELDYQKAKKQVNEHIEDEPAAWDASNEALYIQLLQNEFHSRVRRHLVYSGNDVAAHSYQRSNRIVWALNTD